MASPSYPQSVDEQPSLVCVTCGAVLTPPRRAFCSDRCRERSRQRRGDRHRKRQRVDVRRRAGDRHAPVRQRFVGIDGESVDNRYVLLAAADDDGWSAYIEPRNGEAELRTSDCLRFIARLPKAIVWGFAFSYDVNMMLWELPLPRLERLYETGRVRWHNFTVEYVPKKMLRVTERESAHKDAKKRSGGVVWDMFPWQQSSFANWLADEQLASPAEIDRIRTMKHRRATFTAKERKQIIRYCLSECTYLARGARKLVDTITAGGFTTGGRYYSPASLAKAKMKSEGVKRFMTPPPDHLAKAIDAARFGGRAEVGQSGPIEGPIFQHDINSAYPTELEALPCLACGAWQPTKHDLRYWLRHAPTLCNVSWKPLNGRRHMKWGPFPMRGKIGSLRFPSHGSGWYWSTEVLAAERLADVTIHDAWTFHQNCNHRPFAYVPAMYAQRKKLKAAGDPSEYVLKLALNSTYGALAERQHKQARREPPWRSLMWAGLITAGTRAKMLDILTDDVVMIATDGIFSTSRLPVQEGKGLGEWEVNRYDEMWIAGTGFYFPKKDGEWLDPKTRGFAAFDIDRDRLIGTWASDGREGRYTDSRRRFIGMGTAFHRINGMWPPYARLWRHFIDESVTKTFNLAPRREWLTNDVHDGRSRAPSLAAHQRMAAEDVAQIETLTVELEKRRKRLAASERYAQRRGIPLEAFPGYQKRVESLLLLAHTIDVLQHGVDGANTLPRSDQPMGDSGYGA